MWIRTNCRKFLKTLEHQTTLSAFWEICMQVKKQPLKLDIEQLTGSKLGKEYIKAVYCHLAYLIYKQSTSYKMPGWIPAQARIKTAARNINNLRYPDDTTLMAEREEELKSLLKVKEKSEKAGLKLNIQKTKIMASSRPITSWQKDGETMETVTDFIFLGSKITAVGDCSHEIKKCLLLGRKAMTNLDSVLKSRDITLPTKVRLVTAVVFPVVTYGCESWTIKTAECRIIDASELWCWRRLSRVPWTAKGSNQSILKEISPNFHWKDWCWSWNFNTLATWCKEKTVMLGKIEGRRRRGDRGWNGWMAPLTWWTWAWARSGSSWWTGKPGMLQSMGSQRDGHDWATELIWTETKGTISGGRGCHE